MFVNKTYKCPVHGEFDHWCDTNDPELTQCIKTVEQDYSYIVQCSEKVTRSFKPTPSIWKCDGAAGKYY